MQCLNCYSGEMLKPQDLHPAYLQCPNCQAIELLYQPMDYQERIHALDYDVRKNEETGEEEYKPQIISTFGGKRP